MKPRHIREIKPLRDRQCVQDLGPEYEYVGNKIDFAKFNTLKQFYEKHPELRRYYKRDCTTQKVPNQTTDPKKHVYVNADTRWKCDKLAGHWDPNALSRKDYKMLGACFVKPQDKQCAQHDHRTLMQMKKGTFLKGHSVPLVTVSRHKSACEKARTGCGWVPGTGHCHAKSTLKNEKNRAAKKIQQVVRERAARRAEAAKKIQRALKARVDATKRNQAARKIQQALREKAARVAEANKRNQAVRKIQKALKARKIQKALKARAVKRDDAAKKVQVVVRKHQQRAERLPSDWPVDLRQPGLKRYLLNYYAKSKDQWPVKTMPLRVPEGENRCVQTTTAEPKMTVPQALLHAVARGMTPVNHGLLAWHSTGSGKTCSAAAIMDAYWKNPNKEIVFCTSIEAKAANPPETFRKCLNTFLKRGISEAAMTRRVRFFSFAQLAHYLQLHRGSGPVSNRTKRAGLLDNAVLIIDEVQNLLKPLPNQVTEHKVLYDYLVNNALDNLHVYILTATPGETPQDIADLLNLIRDRRVPPINPNEPIDVFKEKIRGLVQWYDTNNDLSRFPRVSMKDPNTCNMSGSHYAAYVKALREDLAKKQVAFPNAKYFALSRKYSNHNFVRSGSLSDFSCKIPQIHDKLRKYPDQKHWIYSAFYEKRGYGQGVMAVKNTLISELGYEELTPRMAKQMVLSGNFSAKPRFCVLTTTNLENRNQLTDLLAVYNHDLNVNGALCHVMLASQKYNEGVDLKAVRHIHLLEPLLTEGMRQQAIGRARRSCSHFQLNNMSDWNVKIHEYMSVYPQQSKRNYTQDIRRYTTALEQAQAGLDSIKGMRGVKPQRDALTAHVSEIKASLKEIAKAQKEQNNDDVFFIDQHIRNLAKEHAKPTQRLLDAMKETSIGALIH